MNVDGQSKSGTTRTVRLAVGEADFLDVKIPDDQALAGQVPPRGALVDWGVVAMAGERGKLSVSRAMDWSEVIGADAPADRRGDELRVVGE